MAKAPALLPGYQYRVKANGGDYAGDIVTILDNVTFPDDHPMRRKVTVEHDGNTIYMLPRVIEDLPIAANPAMAATMAPPPLPPTPVQAAVEQVLATQVMANAHNEAPVSTHPALQPITDPMDPRLDHLRPKLSKVNKYESRTLANGMSDVEFFLTFTSDVYRKTNEMRPVNVCLQGDTQSGKTFLVEKLAVEWSRAMAQQQRDRGEVVTYTKPMPIFTLSGSAGITDYDLFGQTTSYTDPTTGVQSLIWLSGIADQAARCGGILYLDEANFMGERVTSSLHPLLDHRHTFTNRNKAVWKAAPGGGGQYMAEAVTGHLDLWVIATINEGYKGTGLFNEAFAGRFKRIGWGYNEDVEKRLVKSPTIRLFAEALRTARQAKQIGTPIGTSALEQFKLDIDVFGQEMAFSNLLGLFQPGERKKVETIYVDRSFKKLLEDEVAQAAANAAADAAAQAAGVTQPI